MRLRTLIMPLALGLAARAVIRHQRARQAARDAGARHAGGVASDSGDLVQGFDETVELQGTPLEVDALSIDDAEAAQDLASLEAEEAEEAEIDELEAEETETPEDEEGEEIEGSDDAAIERVDVDVVAASRDAGDLYGGHTPPALDPDLPDDDLAAAEGQTWIEALETSAIENGAEPERELDAIVDDEDVWRPPHASRTRDTPVADHGSGGRRGL
jgi:hypothetical protein